MAIELCRKAAETENIRAICRMADRYLRGEGVEQDEKEAVRLYEEAADKANHPYGILSLAYCLEGGHGIEKDEKRAVRLYRVAAWAGHADAMYNLACCYREQVGGLVINEKKILKLLQRAARAGHVDAKKLLVELE